MARCTSCACQRAIDAALAALPRTVAGSIPGPNSYNQATGIVVPLAADLASIDYGQVLLDWQFAYGVGIGALIIETGVIGTDLHAFLYGLDANAQLVPTGGGLDLSSLTFRYVAVGAGTT